MTICAGSICIYSYAVWLLIYRFSCSIEPFPIKSTERRVVSIYAYIYICGRIRAVAAYTTVTYPIQHVVGRGMQKLVRCATRRLNLLF